MVKATNSRRLELVRPRAVFKPAMKGGVPVKVRVSIEVNFRIVRGRNLGALEERA
jgi:hypothetical protein